MLVEQDIGDIKFGMEQGLDFVAVGAPLDKQTHIKAPSFIHLLYNGIFALLRPYSHVSYPFTGLFHSQGERRSSPARAVELSSKVSEFARVQGNELWETGSWGRVYLDSG